MNWMSSSTTMTTRWKSWSLCCRRHRWSLYYYCPSHRRRAGLASRPGWPGRYKRKTYAFIYLWVIEAAQRWRNRVIASLLLFEADDRVCLGTFRRAAHQVCGRATGENRGGIVRAVRVTTNTCDGNQPALYSAGNAAEAVPPLPMLESRSAAAAKIA